MRIIEILLGKEDIKDTIVKYLIQFYLNTFENMNERDDFVG